MPMPREKRYRRAIKLYEVAEVQSLTNLFNRNKVFETGDSPLTLAAQQGHDVIVASLIRAGADVNKLDGNGRAAIHVASQFNDLQTLKVLLEHKADPNKLAADDTTPLYIASERGFVDIVETLLDAGADPNVDQPSLRFPSALFCAVACGSSDCASVLLQHGADPTVVDSKGQSPLRVAIVNGDVKCVEVLAKHEAVRVDSDALSLAIDGENAELVGVLLRAGCDLEQPGKTAPVVRPLIRAALRAAADIVDALLAAGADVNGCDELGNNALLVAVLAVVDPQWKHSYSARLSGSATPSGMRQPRLRVQSGVSAASTATAAAAEGHVRCVMSLVQGGADVASVWPTFSAKFPSATSSTQGITFQQMVVCEVLTQAYGFANMSSDETSDFVCRLLKLGEFGLVKLVYSAGVNPSTAEQSLLECRAGNDLFLAMLDYVTRLRRRPRSLKDSCRRRLRQLLSWNALYLVGQLTQLTDNALVDYLCIMDTDHYTEV